jgi:tetratricopeptide (TPR) repeat protein
MEAPLTAATTWPRSLIDRPEDAVGRLLAGYADISPYNGLSARSYLLTLFEGLPDGDAGRKALDAGLLAWLEKRRKAGVPNVTPLHLEKFVGEVQEAFDIVGLLALPGCAEDFRNRFVVWNNWAGRLIVSRQRDAREAFWRALALSQRAGSGGRRQLEAHWLELCEGAGGEFPAHYLATGLLGLQFMPKHPDAPEVLPWLSGLARWGTAQQPPLAEFRKQWWAQKTLHPNTRTHWQDWVSAVLDQPQYQSLGEDIRQFWMNDIGAGQQQSATAAKPVRYPDPQAIKDIMPKLSDALATLKPKIEGLIAERKLYAEITGNADFLVKSACNIGMELIKTGDKMMERGALAESLARAALVWQPANHFAWALWCNALEAQGAFEAAENLGWETIRRFPDDVQWRNQLADLLARLPGREAEAEAVLRETIRRFPDDVVARNQLADLLARLPGREAEAEAVLRETIRRFPDDVVARNQLAELLIDGNRTKDAMSVVAEAKAAGVSDEATIDLEARLLVHEGNIEKAADVLEKGCADNPRYLILARHQDMLKNTGKIPLHSASRIARRIPAIKVGAPADDKRADKSSDPVLQAGHLRKLVFDNEKRHELESTLSNDPNFAYALHLRNSPAESAGVFAAKFAQALEAKDASALNALERSHSSEAKIIDFARALALRDEAAASRCAAWTAPASTGQSHSIVTLQNFLKLRFGERLSQSLSGAAFIDMIAANDNMVEDLIESAVAGIDIPIAA